MATEAPAADAPAEEKKKKPILLIILGVVGVIVIAVGVAFGTLYFSGYYEKKAEIAAMDKVDELEKVTQRLEQTLGRLPSEQEVAKAAGLETNDYYQVLDSLFNVLPIDDIPENLLPADLSADPLEKFSSKQFLGQVVEILKDLPENQKMVVALHYQEDLSYREIAAVMDLTPGRISQLHTQAMISIRAMLGA